MGMTDHECRNLIAIFGCNLAHPLGIILTIFTIVHQGKDYIGLSFQFLEDLACLFHGGCERHVIEVCRIGSFPTSDMWGGNAHDGHSYPVDSLDHIGLGEPRTIGLVDISTQYGCIDGSNHPLQVLEFKIELMVPQLPCIVSEEIEGPCYRMYRIETEFLNHIVLGCITVIDQQKIRVQSPFLLDHRCDLGPPLVHRGISCIIPGSKGTVHIAGLKYRNGNFILSRCKKRGYNQTQCQNEQKSNVSFHELSS